MSSMGAVSMADKVSAVKKYLSGKERRASIAREYGISRSTLPTSTLTRADPSI